MIKVNTRVLPGFMELLPEQQLEFDKIMRVIKEEYQRFGFTSLDMPVIERSETLLAKAGGETEKQIYRFKKGTNDLSLRFDLTVPLARYVAEHFNSLAFPFRRCHIGKVYRGESPQRGRFREFYQCDIDVIGHNALSIEYDAEIPCVIYAIFSRLDFGKFTIKVNNRKIMNGLMSALDASDIAGDVLRAIDKIEKISRKDLVSELKNLGLDDQKITMLMEFVAISGEPVRAIKLLRGLGIDSEQFVIGVNELERVTSLMGHMGIPNNYFVVDLSIARGLDYYTGTIYETTFDEYPHIGSICSGGRYDNLASSYTTEQLPGVGISIGLTRLFYQLNEIGLVPSKRKTVADVTVIPLEADQVGIALDVARVLRDEGICTDVLLEKMSMKQRFKYADRKGVPNVVVIGDEEARSGKFTVQNMETGTKHKMSVEGIADYLKGCDLIDNDRESESSAH